MKMRSVLAGIATLVISQNLTVQADDLFALFWRGTAWTKNANGQLVAHPITEQAFVNKVAADNGLNPRSLVFVYRADKHDTAVVMRSNGAFIADVIQMEYNYTDVSNPTGNLIVRQAFLFDEQHDSTIGSVLGVERALRDGNGNLRSLSFTGTFQYSMPETTTVYSGRFFTGPRIRDTSGG